MQAKMHMYMYAPAVLTSMHYTCPNLNKKMNSNCTPRSSTSFYKQFTIISPTNQYPLSQMVLGIFDLGNSNFDQKISPTITSGPTHTKQPCLARILVQGKKEITHKSDGRGLPKHRERPHAGCHTWLTMILVEMQRCFFISNKI